MRADGLGAGGVGPSSGPQSPVSRALPDLMYAAPTALIEAISGIALLGDSINGCDTQDLIGLVGPGRPHS